MTAFSDGETGGPGAPNLLQRKSAVITNVALFPSTDEMTVDSTKDQDGQCSTRGPSVRVGNGHVDTGSHGDQQ